VADDAGALLVRSGLVSPNALDDARARVANSGGTLGEQLVTSGAIADDDLTDFYRSRLLVPQVNPNALARLTPHVVATIPSDMAIELRAIPVSLDGENNLTVAMSDPSDRHAVDEIAFFTGAYVVRAVATQMQIAWCLAHYYGHVTALGQRLLRISPGEHPYRQPAATPRPPRTKGLTGKVNATRHRAVAPVTGPVDVVRPTSGQLDLRPLDVRAVSAPSAAPTAVPVAAASAAPSAAAPLTVPGVIRPNPLISANVAAPAAAAPTAPTAPGEAIEDEPSARMASSPDLAAVPESAPEKPRARSVSGEIRVPVRRAPSIKPLLPQPDLEEEEPLIMIEMREEDDETGRRALPLRRRPIVKSDPPELQARAGEVDLKAGEDRPINVDEPRIVVDEDALAPETGRIDVRGDAGTPAAAITAPITAPITSIDITALDIIDDVDADAEAGALIHDRVIDREPVPAEPPPDERAEEADEDTRETDVVMLDAPKKSRPERHTQVGVGAVPAATRPREIDAGDATTVDLHPAPDDDIASDPLAAPPAPVSDADTNPHVFAAPPAPAPSAARSGAIPKAVIVEDDDEEDEDDRSPHTSEMTAAELDDAIPDRAIELPSEPLLRRRIEHDPVDDGWGPPGTTIPPPLLGAIPGGEDYEENSGAIPMPNVDSSPLIVATPSLPSAGEPSGRALVRALEEATARAIEVIRRLEHTRSRDDVVDVMISHLAETHHRAGFFVTRHAVSRDAGELGMFAMKPRPAAMPVATLRLDRPSTLQDVVGTRLPYRGPMHDDASRAFLVSVLGACPAEILLVPVTVRERVVGVLFGEHRHHHTFDDQLALAARAAGMALERILRAKRG
jgi:hypothetical protein